MTITFGVITNNFSSLESKILSILYPSTCSRRCPSVGCKNTCLVAFEVDSPSVLECRASKPNLQIHKPKYLGPKQKIPQASKLDPKPKSKAEFRLPPSTNPNLLFQDTMFFVTFNCVL